MLVQKDVGGNLWNDIRLEGSFFFFFFQYRHRLRSFWARGFRQIFSSTHKGGRAFRQLSKRLRQPQQREQSRDETKSVYDFSGPSPESECCWFFLYIYIYFPSALNSLIIKMLAKDSSSFSSCLFDVDGRYCWWWIFF